MGKLTIQDIARILTERDGLEQREANRFASEMFAVIQQYLETDHLAKVKGLGTFKIIDVDARESVSVRTGERVVIDGHSKITFTPDAVMRELVNKPFSQFDTVVLNDGVEFDDIPNESADAKQQEPDDDEQLAEQLQVDMPAQQEEQALPETIAIAEETVREAVAEQETETV
ncbi:MAG: HU family DNA-binding protein, partial [Prevotella sp.]|nr:HU family DNA-binding protein [Prevotella sp.]